MDVLADLTTIQGPRDKSSVNQREHVDDDASEDLGFGLLLNQQASGNHLNVKEEIEHQGSQDAQGSTPARTSSIGVDAVALPAAEGNVSEAILGNLIEQPVAGKLLQPEADGSEGGKVLPAIPGFPQDASTTTPRQPPSMVTVDGAAGVGPVASEHLNGSGTIQTVVVQNLRAESAAGTNGVLPDAMSLSRQPADPAVNMDLEMSSPKAESNGEGARASQWSGMLDSVMGMSGKAFRQSGFEQAADRLIAGTVTGTDPTSAVPLSTVLHGVHHSVQPSATLTAAADYTLSLQKPGWQADLGELVARMQIRGQRLAEVRLDPPDLGPIRIHLSHGADHTQVVLQAQHPDTRLLLQMTADRLRDNLAESGHAQVQVQVQVGPDSGSGAFSRSDRDTASGFGTPGRAHHGSETFDDAPMEITHLRLSGRLDLFA